MQSEKEAFINSKLPNVALFIAMTFAYFVLMSANHVIMARLILGTFETDAERVLVHMLMIFAIMAFGAFCMKVNLKPKKAQLNTNIQP